MATLVGPTGGYLIGFLIGATLGEAVRRPLPAHRPAPHGGTSQVEEVDGFIVAGTSQVASPAGRKAEVGSILGAGPIAVIDEPSPELLRFPDLSLNGPSTASAGLYSLAGNRLA